DTARGLDDQMIVSTNPSPMQHGQFILSMIEQVLGQASLTLQELDAIAFGCGPGAFTGIRIACAVAQGLGFVTNCRVIPISSLALFAQSAHLSEQSDRYLVMTDAHMGAVYYGAYAVNSAGLVELVGVEKMSQPNQIVVSETQDYCGVGDGFSKYGDLLRERLGQSLRSVSGLFVPKIEAMLLLARAKYNRQQWIAPQDAMPIYLR
ncbi:MAG: peptidase M22 glycoprotease, partial [uncultured bacterium]